MRSLLVAVVMVIIVGIAIPMDVFAVGYYRVGEERVCSPLVARGIVPDTMNQLTEAFPIRYLGSALDSVAVEVRTFLEQVGQRPEAEVSVASVSRSEAAAEIEPPSKPAKVEKKPVPVPKVAKDKKQIKTTAKKKPVKQKTAPKPQSGQ